MAELSIKSDVIAKTLIEEIIRGELAPGSRLGQDHIAERFDCSHVPVREALQRIVQAELAVSVPRRGVRVVVLDDEDHAEIRDMRIALEPLALRRAIGHFNPKDIEKIEQNRDLCDDAGDPIGWERANRAFHLAILKPSGRPRLLQRIEVLQRLSAKRFHALWQKRWVSSADRDHAAIVRAIIQQDADTACAVLVRHLSRR